MSKYSHFGWLTLAIFVLGYGLYGMLVKPDPFDESKFSHGSGKIVDAVCSYKSGAKITISNFEEAFHVEPFDHSNNTICAGKNEKLKLIGKEATFIYMGSRILSLDLNGKSLYQVSDVYAKKLHYGSKFFFFGLVFLVVAVVKYTHNKPLKQDK